MRDFIVMVGFLGLLPLCFLRPSVGIMVWTWFAIMNPHREAFGFAQTFNFNIIIALVTMGGCLISGEIKKRYPLNLTAIFFLAWSGWTMVTSQYAIIPSVSWEFFHFIPSKVFIYAFMLFVIIDRETRLIALTWMLCISIGYYGARIGIVSIMEGGKNLGAAGSFGPYGTMIQDRNHLSLAITMTLPLLNFLRLHTADGRIKKILMAVLLLSILAIISSYSRGALLAMVATGSVYILYSRYKIVAMTLSVAALSLTFLFMPAEWKERMNVSKSAEHDKSFLDRVGAWEMAYNIASDRPMTGGGFRATEQPTIAARYGEMLKTPLATHSIYFQVMGDHGFMGLFLFLGTLGTGLLATFRVRFRTKGKKEWLWAYDMAMALQASYVGFLIGGAALSLAYYDGLYVLVVLSAVLWRVVKNPEGQPEKKWLPQFMKKSSSTAISPTSVKS